MFVETSNGRGRFGGEFKTFSQPRWPLIAVLEVSGPTPEGQQLAVAT